MQQSQNQRFTCTGCGNQFNSRDELQKHMKTCNATQGTGQKSGTEQTRTAGGGGNYGEGQL
jgi:hypothetical protein